MIVANITSWQGQCGDAEHYYCKYTEVEDMEPKKDYNSYHGGSDEEELERALTSAKEVAHLNKKEGRGSWRLGRKTKKYVSKKQIHKQLIKMFPDQTIITYKERDFFKEMLYYKDGEDLGFAALGEKWTELPTSCYKDLIVPIETLKIKCEDCGHEYKLEEITTEREWGDRILTKFKRRSEMDSPCCSDFYLIWNIIL